MLTCLVIGWVGTEPTGCRPAQPRSLDTRRPRGRPGPTHRARGGADTGHEIVGSDRRNGRSTPGRRAGRRQSRAVVSLELAGPTRRDGSDAALALALLALNHSLLAGPAVPDAAVSAWLLSTVPPPSRSAGGRPAPHSPSAPWPASSTCSSATT